MWGWTKGSASRNAQSQSQAPAVHESSAHTASEQRPQPRQQLDVAQEHVNPLTGISSLDISPNLAVIRRPRKDDDTDVGTDVSTIDSTATRRFGAAMKIEVPADGAHVRQSPAVGQGGTPPSASSVGGRLVGSIQEDTPMSEHEMMYQTSSPGGQGSTPPMQSRRPSISRTGSQSMLRGLSRQNSINRVKFQNVELSPIDLKKHRDRRYNVDAILDEQMRHEANSQLNPTLARSFKMSSAQIQGDSLLSRWVLAIAIILVVAPFFLTIPVDDGVAATFDVAISFVVNILLFLFLLWSPWDSCQVAHENGRGDALSFIFLGQGQNSYKNLGNEMIRDRLKMVMNEGRRHQIYTYWSVLMTTMACGQYVAYTYTIELKTSGEYHIPAEFWLYNFFNITFAVEYLVDGLLSRSWVSHLSSTDSIIDFVSFNYVFVLLFSSWETAELGPRPSTMITLGALRFMRIYRAVNALKVSGVMDDFGDIELEVWRLLFNGVSILCTTAGVVMGLEYESVEDLQKYHTALYFTVVTLTTVGYGNIAPVTPIGRLVVMLVIFSCILILIPLQTSRFSEVNSLRSGYMGTLSIRGHVVVAGSVTAENLQTFLSEFYHEDHHMTSKVKMVVIMESEPTVAIRRIAARPEYRHRVILRVGNILNPNVLRGYGVDSAIACFMLNDKFCSNRQDADRIAALRTVAIKRWKPELTLFLQLFFAKSQDYIQSVISVYDQVICLDELNMKTMAWSCKCPGFSTFMINLLNSSGSAPESANRKWFNEYSYGQGQEIYKARVSGVFVGTVYEHVVTLIYATFKAVAFAVRTETGKLMFNPTGYTLGATDSLFLITESFSIAQRIGDATPDDVKLHAERLLIPMSPSMQRVGSNNTLPPTPVGTRGHLTSSYHDGIQSLPARLYCDVAPIRNRISECIIKTTNRHKISRHVVVIGFKPSLYHFIMPMRLQHINVNQAIVIIDPDIPSDEEWKKIGVFNHVYFVQGSGMERADLLRAGVREAASIVVLSKDQSVSRPDFEYADADTLLVLQRLPEIRFKFFIVHLQHTNSIALVGSADSTPDYNLEDAPSNTSHFTDHLHDREYCAGHVFAAPMMDSLLCQLFFNRDIGGIIEGLTNPSRSFMTNMDSSGSSLVSLASLPIPGQFHECPYQEVLERMLLSYNILCMGLYRRTETGTYYVVTNPHPSTITRPSDRLFALATIETLTEHHGTDIVCLEDDAVFDQLDFSSEESEDESFVFTDVAAEMDSPVNVRRASNVGTAPVGENGPRRPSDVKGISTQLPRRSSIPAHHAGGGGSVKAGHVDVSQALFNRVTHLEQKVNEQFTELTTRLDDDMNRIERLFQRLSSRDSLRITPTSSNTPGSATGAGGVIKLLTPTSTLRKATDRKDYHSR
eukprot:GFYU01003435.1.p1 GENE.GFYU01003435.1~~GFYU01003435.1.p1  ORF type:complete len:1388 (-),score=316.22 GFYU01003435.1:248-4411(-)